MGGMGTTWKIHIKKAAAWTIRALIVGLITGVVITLLAAMIKAATETRQANEWLIFAIPVGALLTTYLFYSLGPQLQQGTIRIMSLITKSEDEADQARLRSYTENVADEERPISTTLAPLLWEHLAPVLGR